MLAAHAQTETKANKRTGLSWPSALDAKAPPGNRSEGPAGATQPDWVVPGALNANINLQQSFSGGC